MYATSWRQTLNCFIIFTWSNPFRIRLILCCIWCLKYKKNGKFAYFSSTHLFFTAASYSFLVHGTIFFYYYWYPISRVHGTMTTIYFNFMVHDKYFIFILTKTQSKFGLVIPNIDKNFVCTKVLFSQEKYVGT